MDPNPGPPYFTSSQFSQIVAATYGPRQGDQVSATDTKWFGFAQQAVEPGG
jgi:hypothetical protein